MMARGFSLGDFNVLSHLFGMDTTGHTTPTDPLISQCAIIKQNLENAGPDTKAVIRIIRDEIDPLLTELALNQGRTDIEQMIRDSLSSYRQLVEDILQQEIPSRFIRNTQPTQKIER